MTVLDEMKGLKIIRLKIITLLLLLEPSFSISYFFWWAFQQFAVFFSFCSFESYKILIILAKWFNTAHAILWDFIKNLDLLIADDFERAFWILVLRFKERLIVKIIGYIDGYLHRRSIFIYGTLFFIRLLGFMNHLLYVYDL